MVVIGWKHQTLASTCLSGFSPVSLSLPWPLLVSLSMSFVSRSRKITIIIIIIFLGRYWSPCQCPSRSRKMRGIFDFKTVKNVNRKITADQSLNMILFNIQCYWINPFISIIILLDRCWSPCQCPLYRVHVRWGEYLTSRH